MKSKSLKNGWIYIVFAFIIMGLLFYSSSQSATEQSTLPILTRILKNEPLKERLTDYSFIYGEQMVSIKERGYFNFVEFFLRKGAHFFSYFFLSLFWFLGLHPRLKSLFLSGVISWLAATGYAGLDEFHQMLTVGRSPLMQDIALDSAGALTASLMCLLIFFSFQKMKKVKKQIV